MSTPTTAVTEQKPRRTYIVPRADNDFGTVVNRVAKKWQDHEWATLLWTSQGEFLSTAQLFDTGMKSKNDTQSSRSAVTTKIKLLDKNINDGLKYVKLYLTEKYKDAAESYYPQFGITHKRNAYILPTDQNQRAEALRQMLKGITEHGFGAKEYGTAYWTPLKTDYDLLLASASNTDGSVSQLSGNKKQARVYLKKALNALVLVLKANYPDTYKEELRSWGFQKEKY